MLAITNDTGDMLHLDPEQNLVTEQNAPWLTDDELPGEYSYSIDAPLNDNNKRFVRHAYRPDLALPSSSMPVHVAMDGVLYRQCTFSFRINNGKLSGYLKIDASEFYDKIRKMSLLELFSEPFYLGDGLMHNPPINLAGRLKQIAQMKPGEFPCTFFPIRDDTFLEDGFTITSTVPTDPTQIGGAAGMTDLGFQRKAYVNNWEKLSDGSFGFLVDDQLPARYGYLVCPQFYLAWVLQQIITKAGYSIESDWLASTEVQSITIKNLTAMNQAAGSLGELVAGHSVVPGMFLPDMTVGEFLKAVKGRFGLLYTYNSNDRICYITQFSSAVAAGAAIDLTEYQTGTYSTDFPDLKGFTVYDFVDDKDDLYKDSLGNTIKPPYQVVGQGETEINLKAGTCQLVRETSPLGTGALWFVPKVRQAGNILDAMYKKSDRYLTSEGKRPNNIGLCFLSYRGMTTDSKGNPYPLGTPGILDGQQVMVGSQALTLGGRFGAWRTYLNAYYQFRNQTQRITQPMLMPVAVLASLQLHRSIFLTLEDQIRRSYLISKLQAEMPGIDGKVRVRLEALTLPSGIDQAVDVDAPIVWIQLEQINTAQQPIGNTNVSGYEVYASLTFRAWSNQTKTGAASVSNLVLQLRRIQKGKSVLTDLATQADTSYTESVEYYTMNGTTAIWETKLLVETKLVNHVRDITLLDYSLAYSLDPGEGYTIIN